MLGSSTLMIKVHSKRKARPQHLTQCRSFNKLLQLSLVFLTPYYVYGTQNEEERLTHLRRQIEEVNTKLSKDFENLQALSPAWQDVVITLGQTGSGKSTLINFLAGKEMTSCQNEYTTDFRVSVKDPIKGMEIGHSVLSQTNKPFYWYDDQHSCLYYDCPGFEDTRSDENDIRNAYAIQTLFKTFEKVKLAVVLSESSLFGGRVKSFLDLIRTLSEFFVKDIGNLPRATCLIITGQFRFQDPTKVRQYLSKEILSSLPELATLSPNSKTLLRGLVDHAQIAFFPKPMSEGRFLNLSEPFLNLLEPLGLQVQRNILTALNHTSIIQITPTLTLSPTAKLFALKMATTFSDRITDFISKKIVAGLNQYCNAQMDDKNELEENDLQDLKRYLKIVKIRLDTFDSSTPQHFINSLKTVFEPCGLQADVMQLQLHLNFLTFLQSSYGDISLPLEVWKNKVLTSKENIENLIYKVKSEIEQRRYQNDLLRNVDDMRQENELLKARLIRTNEEPTPPHQNIHQLYFEATKQKYDVENILRAKIELMKEYIITYVNPAPKKDHFSLDDLASGLHLASSSCPVDFDTHVKAVVKTFKPNLLQTIHLVLFDPSTEIKDVEKLFLLTTYIKDIDGDTKIESKQQYDEVSQSIQKKNRSRYIEYSDFDDFGQKIERKKIEIPKNSIVIDQFIQEMDQYILTATQSMFYDYLQVHNFKQASILAQGYSTKNHDGALVWQNQLLQKLVLILTKKSQKAKVLQTKDRKRFVEQQEKILTLIEEMPVNLRKDLRKIYNDAVTSTSSQPQARHSQPSSQKDHSKMKEARTTSYSSPKNETKVTSDPQPSSQGNNFRKEKSQEKKSPTQEQNSFSSKKKLFEETLFKK